MGWLWEVIVDVAQGVVSTVLVLLGACVAAVIFGAVLKSIGVLV